jgi:hypothetical protein
MKPHAKALRTDDRTSTREELGEVIGLLLELHQLPFGPTIESLEASESRLGADAEEPELWPDADRDDWSGAEIEPLTNIILGRRHELN